MGLLNLIRRFYAWIVGATACNHAGRCNHFSLEPDSDCLSDTSSASRCNAYWMFVALDRNGAFLDPEFAKGGQSNDR